MEKDLYHLGHKYQFYDDKGTLFYEIVLNNYNFEVSNFDNNIFYVNDEFYVEFKDNYNKMVLSLGRINPRGNLSFNFEHINDDFNNITYSDKSAISLKIDKNKDNISSNLIAINDNKINNILSNKTYLKTFIMFYYMIKKNSN